jgi:hypothetical protein
MHVRMWMGVGMGMNVMMAPVMMTAASAMTPVMNASSSCQGKVRHHKDVE